MGKLKQIGGFWRKTSKSGLDFYSGNIQVNNERVSVVIFENTMKKNPKQPDYNIFLSENNGYNNNYNNQSQNDNDYPQNNYTQGNNDGQENFTDDFDDVEPF